MVQVALLTLNERGGSTRQEIWKCIETKFPEANHTSYRIAMRKLTAKDGPIKHGSNSSRFTLEKNFKIKALKRMAQGLPLKAVLSSKAMTNPVKKALKAKKKPAKKSDKKKDGKGK
jgi:hypothetical protein